MPSVPEWDDLDQFLDVGDFGVAAQLLPKGGPARTITGIFYDPAMEAHLGEFKGLTTDPKFTAKARDLAGVQRGDVLDVPGNGLFDVLQPPHGDGLGMATLLLSPQ